MEELEQGLHLDKPSGDELPVRGDDQEAQVMIELSSMSELCAPCRSCGTEASEHLLFTRPEDMDAPQRTPPLPNGVTVTLCGACLEELGRKLEQHSEQVSKLKSGSIVCARETKILGLSCVVRAYSSEGKVRVTCPGADIDFTMSMKPGFRLHAQGNQALWDFEMTALEANALVRARVAISTQRIDSHVDNAEEV